MQKVYEGVINHVWAPLVDSTDFATIESAIAASSVKASLFGFLKGNSAVGSRVASGTGSLAASGRDFYTVRSGVIGFRIGPAELSDSQNAFYDKYLLWGSVTGAAIVLMELEGEYKDTSDIYSLISDVDSQLLLNASVISDVDSQLTVTHSLLSDIESQIDAGVTLTAAQVSSLVDDIWDEKITGGIHNDSNSAGRYLRNAGGDQQIVLHSGTAQAGAAGTITLDAGASATNEIYVGNTIQLTGGTGVGQSRTILDYDGGTKVATVDSVWVTNPDATTTFDILARTGTLYIDEGIAQAGAATTITLDAEASADNDVYNGALVTIVSGTGSGQTREITDYVGSTKVATVGVAWGTNPDSTSVYAVLPSATADAAGSPQPPTAAENAAAVWDAQFSAHSDAGSFGSVVSSVYSLVTKVEGSQFDVISNYLSSISALVSDVDSQLLLNASMISDVDSQVVLNASMISDAHSAAILAASHASDAHSLAQDIDSQLLVTQSLVSDIDSQLLVTQSLLSDVESQVDLIATSDYLSSVHSDLRSQISGITASVSASDISDIASRVWSEKWRVHSLASSFGSAFSAMWTQATQAASQTVAASNMLSGISALVSDVDSQLLLNASMISDVDSQLLLNASLLSDVESQVDLIATSNYLSTVHSDLRSQISGITASISASDISDIASRVWSEKWRVHSLASSFGSAFSAMWTEATQAASQTVAASNMLSGISALVSDVDSQLLLNASIISDVDSQLTVTHSLLSDVESQVDLLASSNYLSTVHSDLRSQISGITASVSASDISDIASRVWSEKYRVHSLASSFGSAFSSMWTSADAAASRALLNQSRISDAYSQLVAASNMLSGISALVSDIDSQVLLNASMISDADSQLLLNASMISDVDSQLDVTASKVVLIQSNVSDVDSQLTVTHSLVSDIDSQLLVTHSLVSDIDSQLLLNASAASDAASAAQQAASRALVIQSRVSDVESQLDVTHSLVSDIDSQLLLNASAISDLDSQVVLNSSTISDIYSLVSNLDSALSGVKESSKTIVSGAAEAGTLSTTQMTTDLSESTDDHYIGRIIIWKTGVLADQATDITDYSGTNGLLTFTATTEAPSAGDTFVIL